MGESPARRVEHALAERVSIVPYDPEWPKRFDDEAAFLRASVPAGLIGRIEHFGSTAVPGLAAKPIVDMLVEVRSLRDVQEIIAPILENLGYEYFWRPAWHDPLIPEYAWFIKRDAAHHRTHHIHMLEPGATDWERLYFRDYLIAHPRVAHDYEALKRKLANAISHDRIAYAQAKTDFITRTTDQARAIYAKN